jgi:hypothetical protein
MKIKLVEISDRWGKFEFMLDERHMAHCFYDRDTREIITIHMSKKTGDSSFEFFPEIGDEWFDKHPEFPKAVKDEIAVCAKSIPEPDEIFPGLVSFDSISRTFRMRILNNTFYDVKFGYPRRTSRKIEIIEVKASFDAGRKFDPESISISEHLKQKLTTIARSMESGELKVTRT